MAIGVVNVNGATYYGKPGSAPNLRTNWGTLSGGGGTNPANFTTAGDIFIIESGVTMTTTNTWNVTGAGSTIKINTGGILIASNSVTATVMTVESGATYQHNQNGGTIPTATWDAASNCVITGITTAAGLTGFGQTFGNFTWNCTNQTSNFYIASNLTIAGNFSVSSTGTVDVNNHALRMSNTTTGYTMIVTGNVLIDVNTTFKMNNNSGSCIMNIGGNFTLNNGADFVIVSGGASSTVNVSGSVNISGGTLSMNENDNVSQGTLNVKGNFTFSSGIITAQTDGWKGNINFTGTTTQTYSKTGGSISNTINFTINNSSILDMGTSIIDGSDGVFILSSGGNIITSNNGGLSTSGATGSIQLTGTRTYSTGANYTYNGTVSQVTGNGLTGANYLTINNSAGVKLSTAIIVSGLLTLANGTLDMANTNLSVGSVTGTGNLTHSSGAAGARTLIIGTDNTSPAAYSGVISNGTATSVALTKTGTGTLILSGTNTYTGTTTISVGTLKLGSTSALGGTSGTTSITSGAVLDLNGYTLGTAEGLTINGTGITFGGALINSSSTGVSYSGTVALGSVCSIGTTGDITITGAMSGNYALTKVGYGILTIGTNTSTQSITVSSGTLKLGSASALGAISGITTVASGAVLDLNGITLSTAELLTLNGTGLSNGGALINSSGTATTYTGAITLGSGSSIGTTGNITLGGGITGGYDLTKVGSATLSLGSTTSTLGSLTISTGTLISTSVTLNLAGNFTNSGIFTHNNGTVIFNGNGAQIINSGGSSFYNFNITNTGGTCSAITNGITVLNTFTTNVNSTLDMGTTVLIINNTPANSGTIKTQNTSTAPISTGKTWNGTVQYNASTGGQTVVNGTYNNLSLSNTNGTQTANGNITVNGTLLTTVGSTLNMVNNQLLGTLSTITNGGVIQTQNSSSTPIPAGKTWGGTVQYDAPGGGQTIINGTYGILNNNNTSNTNNASGDIRTTTLNTSAGGTLNMVTYALVTTNITNSGIIRTQNTSASPLPSGLNWGGTVQYDATGGGQTVMTGTYGILNNNNTNNTNSASGPIIATTLNTSYNGTLNMSTYTLGVTNGTNSGNIRTQNTTSNPISTGLNWSGTVTFDASAAQTIPASTFKSLVFSGSGIKTLGSITISNGGSLTSNNLVLNFTGDFINNGTALNAGSSPITITGTADQNITGFITTGLISMTKTAGIATLTGNVTGGGFTINGNGGTLSLGTGLTHASTGNVILTAGILNGGSSTLTDAANWTNNGGTFSAGTGTITMTGTPITIGGTVTTTFNNLTLGNGGTQNYSLGLGQTVNGILNLQNNTLFSLGLYNLTLGISASCIGSFGSNCRIIADQSGQIIKLISSSNINNPFTFPIGDAGNSDYSPITLNFSSGTFAPGAYVAVNVKNTKHPQNMSPTNFLKRYWTINQSGITSFICNVTGTFLNSDVTGNWNLQNAAEYTGLLPWIGYTALGTNTLTANGVTAFGDFTGMGMPVFTTDVSNLSGYLFTYSQGKGPSGSIQFYVSQANNLSDKLTVTAPTDFEVSFDNSVFQSSVSITPSNGVLNQTQIYVRLKAGLTVGSYTNENITFTTPGAATLYVPVSGTVTPSTYCNSNGNTSTPYSISLVNFNTLSNPSSTKENNGYSDNTSQSTNIFVGSTYPLTVNINTTGSDRVYATAWIDWNNNGVFEAGEANDLGSATANGKTSLCPLNVIVPAGASIGSTRMRISCKYNGSITDPCNNGFSGEVEDYTLNVFNPIVVTSTAALSGFSYAVGSGPSSEQTFIITGTGIFDNITVTPPAANFEISTVSGGVFQTSPITLTKDLNNKINSTIYVRLIAGLSIGSTGSQNIVLSSTNTIPQYVVCSGIVVPGISAGGGGSYCSNSTINLTSSSNGLSNLYWTGPNNYYSTLPSPSIANATAAMDGTYTVSGNYVPSGNMVINGDFSQQYAGFTSSYSLAAQNGTGLNPEGTFDVVALPSSRHGSFCSCTDHTTGSPGFQLVINGAGTEQTIWSPSTPIAVSTNTNYQFTYWVQTVVKNNDPSPSKLKLFVNNVAAGPIYIANDTTGIWKQFVYNWNSGSSTTANLALKNENFTSGGNDFAIDDIVFQRVYTSTSSVSITVIATSSPASLSVTASANPVFSGTNVTFTATPTNGGTGPIYQWSVNGSNVGTNNPTYSYIPSYGDVVSCSMTSNSFCLSDPNPINASVSMNVITVQNYWLGTNSTNWGTASNWTRGTVPAFGDNIVFATTTNPANTNPINNLVLDIDRTIGNLTNLSPVSLVIPPAKCLTVNGNITTNGVSSPGSIYIQADHNGTVQNGTLIFPNASSVYATVEMYSKAYCNNKSTTPHSDYKWQYFGIPVEAIPANPTFYGSFVRSWDESKDAILHWRTLSNDSILKPFYGYEITQEDAKTIIFSGKLVNRDFISDKLVISPAPAAFPGQHIFANPYTAAINIKYLNFGTDADSTVYLYNTGSIADWTSSLGSNTLSGNPGQYTAIPQNTAGNLMQLDVPSMQAMLIRPNTKHTTFDNFTFGISYNSVIIKNSSLQKAPDEKKDSTTDKIAGTLIELKSKKYSDRMWLFSHTGCSRSFDNGWDGTKIMGSALTPQIFAIEPDGNYQVNTVDDLNNTELGFQAGQDNEYTLTFTHQNLKRNYSAMYLYDIAENKTVDITESGTIYSFIAESTPTSQKRFIIVTRNIETDLIGKGKQMKVFNSGNTVFVENLSNQNGELVIYDMMGRCLKTAKFSPYGITAVQVGNISGAYDVTALTSNERVSKKIILAK